MPATPPLDHQGSSGDPMNAGGSGLNVFGWAAVFLAVTSCAAILIMLVLKWVTGGEEVWPWFTRYAYFAFPGSVVCLLLSLVLTLAQRRRA
ncbi:hypothetical protein [Kocuria soli]|nr:hypothetical protein [Kocuria soli]